MASKDEYESPGDPVSVTFYPKNVASSSKGDTSVTADLSTVPRHLYTDELGEKAKDAGMPIEEHYSAYVALRISFMDSKEERRQLLACRLLSLATYGES